MPCSADPHWFRRELGSCARDRIRPDVNGVAGRLAVTIIIFVFVARVLILVLLFVILRKVVLLLVTVGDTSFPVIAAIRLRKETT